MIGCKIMEYKPETHKTTITTKELVSQVLKWYHPDSILVEKTEYKPQKLLAYIRSCELNYGLIDMEYLTATQMTLILSQMAYALAGCLCFDDNESRMNEETFKILLENIPQGKCLLARQEWTFRKKILKDTFPTVSLSAERIKITKGHLIIKCKIDIEKSSASGKSTFLMPLIQATGNELTTDFI